uniref:Protein Wnt n=1 Tax=Sinocyclocheilus rhinocerous TaxID=307959 RepID=A0A673KJA3_9TELE
CHGKLWAVGSPLVMDPNSICRKTKRLAGKQAELCQTQPEIVNEVAKGAKLGVRECQYQFRFRRWNCTSQNKYFGKILQQGDLRRAFTRTAFVYAITAAGVTHAVTQACSMGELLQCGCEATRSRGPPPRLSSLNEQMVHFKSPSMEKLGNVMEIYLAEAGEHTMN